MPTDNPGQWDKTQKYQSREQLPDPGSLGVSPCCPAQLESSLPCLGLSLPKGLLSITEHLRSRLLPCHAQTCLWHVWRGGFAMTEEPQVVAHWGSAGTWWPLLPMEHPSCTGGACPAQNLPCEKTTPPPCAKGMLWRWGDGDLHPLRLPSPSSILGYDQHKRARSGVQHGEGHRCALSEGGRRGPDPGVYPKAVGSDLWPLLKTPQAHTQHPELLAEPRATLAAATRPVPASQKPACILVAFHAFRTCMIEIKTLQYKASSISLILIFLK